MTTERRSRITEESNAPTEEQLAEKARLEAEAAAQLADENEAEAAAAKAEADAAAAKEAAEKIAVLKARQEAGEELSEEELAALAPAEEEEVIISIGDTPIEESTPAPAWVRNLRKEHREAQRRLRELEAENQALKTPAAETAAVKKPELEDFGYDTEQYDAALTKYLDAKRQEEDKVAKHRQDQQAQTDEWNAKLAAYETSKAKLPVKDYDEAEAVALATLSAVQQGIIVQAAADAAVFVYATGKNAERAKKLAEITDPVKFAWEAGKLEGELKMSKKPAPPAPEKIVKGGGAGLSGASDNQLEKLREEAAKTGDYSKVRAYKASKKSS